MAYAPYDGLLNFTNIFGNMIAPYDVAMGGVGLFYLFVYFAIILAVAIASESPAGVGVFTLLAGIVLLPFVPSGLQTLFYGIAVFGLAITLYKLFMHKRGAQI